MDTTDLPTNSGEPSQTEYEWLEGFYECEQLSENQIKEICDKIKEIFTRDVWETLPDESQRRAKLQKVIRVFIRLCQGNEGLRVQLLQKFLRDFIFANEQLIHLNDTSLKTEYDAFLQRIPLSMVMRELILLNGASGVVERTTPMPKWFLTSVNKKLSEGLVTEKGLSHLLVCFNDLGGESFWNNSVILSSIATLLSTKPQCVESYQKYAISMFSQFLDIMRNSKFGNHAALLFVLTVDKLYLKVPFVVEVQLVDKIIRPWEMLLERGIQNPSSVQNGLWNSNLDGAVVVLKSWLSAQPQNYNIRQFSFSSRFLKLIPLFLHFCGQAAVIEELKEFSTDLSIIIAKLISDSVNDQGMLLKYILNDGGKTHGFLKVENQRKAAVVEVKENAISLKYPVYLEIIEDPLDEEALLDLKLQALRLVLKNLPNDLEIKAVVILMSSCLNTWLNDGKEVSFEDEEVRFVPALDQLISEHPKRLGAVYVLGAVVDILGTMEDSEFSTDILLDMLNIATTIFKATTQKLSAISNVKIMGEMTEMAAVESQTTALAVGLVSAILANAFDDEDLKKRLKAVGSEMNQFCKAFKGLTDASIIELYNPAFENCKQLLDLFSVDLGWDVTSEEVKASRNFQEKRNKISRNQLEEWQAMLDGDEEAMKGGVLIQIAQALRKKNRNVFSKNEHFEWVWKSALDKSSNTDSYVFLASINVLAELSYWQTELYLPRLVEVFVNPEQNNLENDANLMRQGKLGEALAKVFKQLGDFSTFYFDQFANSLLHLTKTGDELIRASAISSFADLIIACQGKKYDTMLHELFYLVNQYLEIEDSALVRRASIHLLRAFISSADDSLILVFGEVLREINRLLKRLWLHDHDDVVRFHAELALIDLKNIMQRLLST